MRIPTTAELAELWALPVATVHKAMHRLTQDGYLVRHRQRGTFVREATLGIKTVGVYMRSDVLTGPYNFAGTVCQALESACGKAGLKSVLIVDPRTEEAQCEAWPELQRMIGMGRIDAVVSPLIGSFHIPWMDRLPAPVAYITSAQTRNSVGFDLHSFGEKAVRALARTGSRRLGLLMVWNRDVSLRLDGRTNAAARNLLAGIQAGAAAANLDLPDERIESVEEPFEIQGEEQARHGYTMTHRLLERCPDLDGLIVYPDSMAQGAMCALLERRASAPLPRLLFHRNRELPFFCPLPVLWLECTARDAAQALLAHVRRGNAPGRKARETIGFRLVEGERALPVQGGLSTPCADRMSQVVSSGCAAPAVQ